jgi:hypothetical protein
MKRFITSVALLVCTMLMTGSFVQLVAQPNTGGGGATTATTYDAVCSGLSGNAVSECLSKY